VLSAACPCSPPPTATLPPPTATLTVAPTITSMQAPTSAGVETLIPTPRPTSPPTPADSGLRIVTVELAGGRFSTEVADTGATRAQGLSDREALAPEAAMLFVYESPRPAAF